MYPKQFNSQKMNKYNRLIQFCTLIILTLISCYTLSGQGGASAHFDALHAFDEPYSNGEGGIGIFGFILLFIVFIFGLYILGFNLNKDEKNK